MFVNLTAPTSLRYILGTTALALVVAASWLVGTPTEVLSVGVTAVVLLAIGESAACSERNQR